MAPKPRSENLLIHSIERALGSPLGRQLRLGIGDDAALFMSARGHETILTCDWFLEGTHFLRGQHPADSVGWKCLARAVSDIAGMGGVPKCFLLSLALPDSLTTDWLDEFLGGLRRAARRFGCVLAGGDTTRRRENLIHVTVIGEVRAGKAVLRSGARPGDILYVSGRLGEAALGLRLLRGRKGQVHRKNPLLKKQLYPEPRLELGQWLAEKRLATAMMDLSDGLSSDLRRLCAASGVGASVDAARIPGVNPSSLRATWGILPLQLALHGGDDYELLFTVSHNDAARLPVSYKDLALTRIGEITRGRGVKVIEETGRARKLLALGWDPFRHAK